MHPGLFDVPWICKASAERKTQKMCGGQNICDVCVHLHNQSNAFYKWNAIATLNSIWVHLECIHLVSDRAFLDVNLVQTYEVYTLFRIPNAWKHFFRIAEAAFLMPHTMKAV